MIKCQRHEMINYHHLMPSVSKRRNIILYNYFMNASSIFDASDRQTGSFAHFEIFYLYSNIVQSH